MSRSDKESAQMGLTFTILGLIFMGNGKVQHWVYCPRMIKPLAQISDTNLFKFMKQLGVGEEERGKGRADQGEVVPEEIKVGKWKCLHVFKLKVAGYFRR